MDSLSFPTFVLVLATEVLILAGILGMVRRRRPEALVLAAFCASVALYVWFHYGFTRLPYTTESLIRPLMTNETLPGALLLLFISVSLFGSRTRPTHWILALPGFELLFRYLGLLLPGLSFEQPLRTWVLLGQLTICLCSGWAIWLLYSHRKAYLEETSENRLTAIYFFIAPAILIFGFNLVWIPLQAMGGEVSRVGSHVLFTLLLSLAIVWQLVYLGRPWSTFYRVGLAETGSAPVQTADKDTTEHLEEFDERETAWRELTDTVETRELFLDPELTLVQLAREIGTNRTALSHLINTRGEMNFNRFINGFRVVRAKRLLHNTSDPVTAIAFDCGFNSKPTFNRVFKEVTGQSPSAFRASRVAQEFRRDQLPSDELQ